MGKIIHKNENDYDWTMIGKRIQAERKLVKLTQQELIVRIGRSKESYRELGKWEKGKTRPQLSDMLELCKVFDCTLGYLLGEYSGKTYEATDIYARIGIEKETQEDIAAKITNSVEKTPDNTISKLMNKFIRDKAFWKLLDEIDYYTVLKIKYPKKGSDDYIKKLHSAINNNFEVEDFIRDPDKLLEVRRYLIVKRAETIIDNISEEWARELNTADKEATNGKHPKN